MTDRDLLELIANQVGILTKDVDDIKANMATKQDLAEVKDDLTEVKDELAGVKDELAGVKDDLAGVKDDLAGVKDDLAGVKDDLAGVKDEVQFIKSTVIKIENDHAQKLAALFNGYTQNSEKLDRVEAEVTRHKEIIQKKLL